jgi:maltose alpha-D-glucosyltransferase / alpha-amylase
MGPKAAYDLWWKNTVIYCVDVELFCDSNGDGVGDFPGLTDKVDYLAGLGVTCIWLMPFYPTPNKDNGYDISDFYGVDRAWASSATWSTSCGGPASGASG